MNNHDVIGVLIFLMNQVISSENNQDNDFIDNKLINLDSITVNRNPISDNEISSKMYIDDELDKITLLKVSQTIHNHLKVSVENDTYNVTKYDKIQVIDITEIKSPNTGANLLQSGF